LLPMELPSMSSAAGSRARMFPKMDQRSDSLASSQGYGSNTCVWFASYDLASSSWRTSQGCFIEGRTRSSGTWPRAGTMRTGNAYQRLGLDFPKRATESGLLPTLVTGDSKQATNGSRHDRSISDGLTMTDWVRLKLKLMRVPLKLGYRMMGFPIGWTELAASAMPSSLKSQS
jgi:hypothetical protein